jgi:hypothetical protein
MIAAVRRGPGVLVFSLVEIRRTASATPRISPPGTNSLGTANSIGGETVGANMEPQDSRRIDTEIQNENARIDSKIGGICRGC